MLNSRNYLTKNNKRVNKRFISISKDNGITFSKKYIDNNLTESVCQASLLTKDNILFFSNPDSKKRVNMTIKYSNNFGKNWYTFKKVYQGRSAYSSLEVINDYLCILYENGIKSPYEKISFKCFKKDKYAK